MTRTRTGFYTAAALALALLAPPLRASEIVPASRQFEIEPPYKDRDQHRAATVASLGTQGFVVGWETACDPHEYCEDFTLARRLLANGSSPVEYYVPTSWIDEYGWAGELSFANLGEGRFASVACTSAYNTDMVWYRRFAAGQNELDPESTTLSEFVDELSDCEPQVASDGNGFFVIAWRRARADEEWQWTWQHVAQVLGPDGKPVSPEIAVTEPVPGGRWLDPDPTPWPTVGMDADGNFVVLWTDFRAPLHPIWGRHFDRAGNPLGERFRIGSQGTGNGRVAMAMAPSGEFVVAWRAPFREQVMLLSRFTADGRRTGAMTRLAYRGLNPAIALDRTGRVALFWIDGRRPALAVFDASLTQLGPVVFDPPASRSAYAGDLEDFLPGVGVAFGEDGRILTVWVGPRGRGARDSILGRFWRIR